MIAPGTLLNQRYLVIRLLGSGGMSDVFEVRDLNQPDHPVKVLKWLREDSPDLVKRLQQEAEMLQRLPHPGIPRVDPEDGYFCEYLPGSATPVHYLVMEKVPGETLQNWLKHSVQGLSEREAIAYLKQLVKILEHIHHANFLHRDIKPSNIIRKPDGNLVLIDFGISREMTPTYHDKLQRDLTGTYYLFTRGYAPAEQMDGRAVPQSDFFALGRTLIYLLTQTPISELPTARDGSSLQWDSRVPGISPDFARLLDAMTAPLPAQRPQTAGEILRAIAHLEQQFTPGQRQRELAWALGWSILITALCIGIRSLGVLQPVELKAFDAFMQLRPSEPPDPRLLIITIDEADITWQQQQQQGQNIGNQVLKQSLSDQALSLLLTKLTLYKPQVIGLDIFRDFHVQPNHQELIQQLSNPRLIGLCKLASTQGKPDEPSIEPPPEIPADQIGFADLSPDEDGSLRRHVMFMDPPETSKCPGVKWAFSMQIAIHYLDQKNIVPHFPTDAAMALGDRPFPYLTSNFGSYRNLDASGGQIILNYRALADPLAIASHISLRDFLEQPISPDQINNKIILIGTVDSSFKDIHATPVGSMPGVFIHAHMISQILNAVEQKRPLIWVWNPAIEYGWIWFWAIVSSLISWGIRSRHWILLGYSVVLISLGGICLIGMVMGGWLPFIPAVMVVMGAGIGAIATRLIHGHIVHLSLRSNL